MTLDEGKLLLSVQEARYMWSLKRYTNNVAGPCSSSPVNGGENARSLKLLVVVKNSKKTQ